MESRNEIPIDQGNLNKIISAFKKTFTDEFEEPLTTIIEQHKDGLRPLTGYYISAKKGKNQLSKKIAKDVISKFLEVFAADFIRQTINSTALNETLDTIEENGISLGVERKLKPKFNFDTEFLGKQYHVKFLIKKGTSSTKIEEKIIFGTSFSGGFYDMQLLDVLWNKRSLNLGDLGGDFLISVDKLPFIRHEINQRMYDKYKSINLSDVIMPIPELIIKST